jgi:hypothetical protein
VKSSHAKAWQEKIKRGQGKKNLEGKSRQPAPRHGGKSSPIFSGSQLEGKNGKNSKFGISLIQKLVHKQGRGVPAFKYVYGCRIQRRQRSLEAAHQLLGAVQM